MKPFDLKAALRGEPVITRDGRPVKIAGYNTEAYDANKLVGWVGGVVQYWHESGAYHEVNNPNHNFDLFMAPNERNEYLIRCHGADGKFHLFDKLFDSLAKAKNYSENMGLKKATFHEITITE